jgi:bifunctional enzyme CysN/CysC
VENVLDASELTTDSSRKQVERHDVAECTFETLNPIAFDLTSDVAETGRFVIIDNYEIAGGGVVLDKIDNVRSRTENQVRQRELNWDKSAISQERRCKRYDQRPTLVLIRGPVGVGKKLLAKQLETELFNDGKFAYYLGLSDSLGAIGDQSGAGDERDEYIRRLGEVGHLFTGAGMILITTVSDLDDYELDTIETLNKPNDSMVINVGEDRFTDREVEYQLPADCDMSMAVEQIKRLLEKRNVQIEYYL